MDLKHLCMGCMENKGESAHCPGCGWVEHTQPASPLHLPPRTLLHEKYLLGRILGQGGFGITYLAWDIYLDRKLAVKEYFPREFSYRSTGVSSVFVHSAADEEEYAYGLEKFLDEAKTLARFDGHPNIISIKDFFKANGTAYLVMNYLDGLTLKDYLEQRGGTFSYSQGLAVIIPVLDALEAIHDKGILHRDISPDNIFITATGRVILLDFGAARHALGERGSNLSIILKPGYAPEEQYRKKGAQGPWTDIYSTAATLYYVITGTMPLDALDRLASDHLIHPSQAGVIIGAEEETVLLKALAVRSGERYQTVQDFREALLSIVSSSSGAKEQALEVKSLQVDTSPGVAPETGYANKERPDEQPYPEAKKQEAWGQPAHPTMQISIGRAGDNNLVLTEGAVSRYHALLNYSEGSWLISDLGSKHGTYLDDTAITGSHELQLPGQFRVSGVTLTFDGKALTADSGESFTLPEDSPAAASLSGHPPAVKYQNRSRRQAKPASSPGKTGLLIAAASLSLIILAVLAIMLLTAPGQRGVIDEPPPPPPPPPPEAADVLEYGTIEFAGGTYTGELKNGLPHGEGTLVLSAGRESMGFSELVGPAREQRYVGQWQNGEKHGSGVLIRPDGSRQVGLWQNNVYMGSGNN